MTSRDTSADAREAFIQPQPDGRTDYSSGVPRRDCPYPPDSSAALSWYAQWDQTAEHTSWLMRQRNAGALKYYGGARDLLVDIGHFLRDLRSSKAVSAHRARHRDLEERVLTMLNALPQIPRSAASETSEAARQ